jgi:hypothetical protein
MSKKWFSIGLVSITFAWTIGAVANDPFAAHKALINKDVGLINTGKAVSVCDRTMEAARMIEIMEKSGDRSLLPYLAEKSLEAANPRTVRERAAAAYVKIADLDESVEFMRKIFAVNDNKGYWRSTIAPLFLQKVEAAISNHTITDETLKRVFSVLLAYAQSPANSQEADYVDVFLVNHCAGYQTSIQRLSMAKSISDGGNDLEKNHFLPITESVEALPKKQRTDLRKRFPNLPPLPEDKNAGTCSKTALAIGAAFAALCAAVWLAAKRRKTQTR